MVSKKGFTLFELLVSISIIAILMAVATVSFSAAQRKARDSKRVTDLNSIQKSAEQFYSMSNYLYPTTSGVGVSWSVGGQTLMELYPVDPKGVGWTAYISNVGTTGYCICAYLENKTGNSLTSLCSFQGVGSTGDWYCVKNQQ